ncbi:MAG: GNAT family N-acetyltransferase [Maricaulaceae bacterium]
MLKARRTGLRAIEPTDLEPLRAWRNDPDLRQYFREYREISPDSQKRWYDTVVLGDDRTRMFAIVELTSGRLLGACGLCWIDWLRRSADFSIYIGADGLYIDEVFATEAARLLLRYGFDELGLHRVWAEIYAIDAPKREFLPSLGFQLEGRLREAHFTNGQWVDSLFYGLLAKEYAPVGLGLPSGGDKPA